MHIGALVYLIDWTNFNRLAVVQVAVSALTQQIQDDMSPLLLQGSALQEVILTSDTVLRDRFDVTNFLFDHLSHRQKPIIRLRLPMLCRFNIGDSVLPFLQHQRHLLQELCVPLQCLTPVVAHNHIALFRFVLEVYFMIGNTSRIRVHVDSPLATLTSPDRSSTNNKRRSSNKYLRIRASGSYPFRHTQI